LAGGFPYSLKYKIQCVLQAGAVIATINSRSIAPACEAFRTPGQPPRSHETKNPKENQSSKLASRETAVNDEVVRGRIASSASHKYRKRAYKKQRHPSSAYSLSASPSPPKNAHLTSRRARTAEDLHVRHCTPSTDRRSDKGGNRLLRRQYGAERKGEAVPQRCGEEKCARPTRVWPAALQWDRGGD
jgi:hypothetical protein